MLNPGRWPPALSTVLLRGVCALGPLSGACYDTSRGGEAAPPDGRRGGSPAIAPRPLAVKWAYAGDSIKDPVVFGVAPTGVVVADYAGDVKAHFLDTESGQYLGQIGRTGSGPCEFRGFDAVLVGAASSDLGLYDLTARSITWVSPKWILMGPKGQYECTRRAAITHLDAPATTISPVLVSDSVIVAGGFYRGGRLAVFDRDGSLRRMVGRLPGQGINAPASVIQHAFQARLAVAPDRSRIVVASRHASILEIFGSDGKLHRTVHGPILVEPIFRVAGTRERLVFAQGDSTRFGYVSVAATDDRIFALFSGHANFETPRRANLGATVHVFDWNGQFLEVLSLRGESARIAVSVDGASLFAASDDPDVVVLAYDLQVGPQQ